MGFDALTQLLLATNLLLLFAATYWSVNNWISVSHLQSAPPWILRYCLIHSSTLNSAETHWRAEFIVSNFSDPQTKVSTAYRYGTAVYNDTREDAQLFAQARPANTTHQCWMHPNFEPKRIAMSPVDPGPTKADSEAALISTLVALVSLIVFLGSLMAAVKGSLPNEFGIESATTSVSVPRNSVSMGLSPAQIEKLCTPVSTEPEENEKSMSSCTEVCAICLDDDKDMENAAVLPCKHTFHPACIKGWLQRGAVTCPLCNLRLVQNPGMNENIFPEELRSGVGNSELQENEAENGMQGTQTQLDGDESSVNPSSLSQISTWNISENSRVIRRQLRPTSDQTRDERQVDVGLD